jgi:excisionase family DNA binding protein
MTDDTLTVTEAADELGVGRTAIYNAIYRGRLSVVPNPGGSKPHGGRVRLLVTRESVERLRTNRRRRERHAGAK